MRPSVAARLAALTLIAYGTTTAAAAKSFQAGNQGSRDTPRCTPCIATFNLDHAHGLSDPPSTSLPTSYTVHHHASLAAASTAYPYLIRVVFYDSYKTEGWDRLQITVNPKVPVPEVVKAHAAGYAEAFFSANSIFNLYDNYRRNEFAASGGKPSADLIRFVDTQVAHIRHKVEAKASTSKYWRLMGLVMSQFDGLVEGYWKQIQPSKNLTWHELYLLQSMGDLYDLNVLYPTSTDDTQTAVAEGGRQATLKQQRRYTPGHGLVGEGGFGGLLDCSALIRVDNATLTARRLQVMTQQKYKQQEHEQHTLRSKQYEERRGWSLSDEAAAASDEHEHEKQRDAGAEGEGQRGGESNADTAGQQSGHLLRPHSKARSSRHHIKRAAAAAHKHAHKQAVKAMATDGTRDATPHVRRSSHHAAARDKKPRASQDVVPAQRKAGAGASASKLVLGKRSGKASAKQPQPTVDSDKKMLRMIPETVLHMGTKTRVSRKAPARNLQQLLMGMVPLGMRRAWATLGKPQQLTAALSEPAAEGADTTGSHAASSDQVAAVVGSGQDHHAARDVLAEGRSSTHGEESEAVVVKFWAGHATWRPYYAMIRTWKVYDFPWSETGPVVISGSPGLLFSKDDWYTTDRLLIMETTNGVYNQSLYDHIHPNCALTWQRAMVANYGATCGREWMQLFAKLNSGTYNNQWMVLDVRALQDAWLHDVLWVLEQLPGRVEKADVTSVLFDQGWVSFNVPYFQAIYNASGYPPEQDLWRTAPRARIFARETSSVTSLGATKKLLRLNKYQKDALSDGRPSNAIASRHDLIPLPGHRSNWTRRAFGAVDAKVVDARSFWSRTTHVVSGPTSDDQMPFRWSTSGFTDIAHQGTADEFTFDWQQYSVIEA